MKQNFEGILKSRKVELLINFMKTKALSQNEELYKTAIQEITYCEENVNPIQIEFCGILAIFFLKASDLKKHFCHRWARYEDVEKILDFFSPDSAIMKDYLSRVVPYNQIMDWYEKRYIEMLPEDVIANKLAITLALGESIRPNKIFKEKYSVTYKEHLWYIFRYEILEFYYGNIFDYYGQRIPEGVRDYIFRKIAEKKITRQKALTEIILASKHKLHHYQQRFIPKIFGDMKPTKEELLLIQDTLLSSLGSEYSNMVVVWLKYIKRIAGKSDFNHNDFIINKAPVLLGSTVKSIINKTLEVITVILKENESSHQDTLRVLCYAFLSSDSSVQVKVAKLITKYGKGMEAEIGVQLAAMSKSILPDTLDILQDYLSLHSNTLKAENKAIPEKENIHEKYNFQTFIHLHPYNRIYEPQSFDEVLFFAVEALESEEEYKPYLLPYLLLKISGQITEENILRFEFIAQRAAKLLKSKREPASHFAVKASEFIISYISHFAGKYLSKGAKLLIVLDKQLDGMQKYYISSWQQMPFSYEHLLCSWLVKIKSTKDIVVLSIPTHTPLWIDPVELVKRLIVSKDKGLEIDSNDFQRAILLLAPENRMKALQIAKENLSGEILEVLTYLFDPSIKEKEEVEHPLWWLTASIVKYPYKVPASLNEWGFDNLPLSWFSDCIRKKIISYASTDHPYSFIQFEIGENNLAQQQTNQAAANSLINSLSLRRVKESMGKIFEMPWFHNFVLLKLMNYVSGAGKFYSDFDVRLTLTLQTVNRLKIPYSGANNTFIAYCLLCINEHVRKTAIEVWLDDLEYGLTGNKEIGKQIMWLQTSGLMPIGRAIQTIEKNIIMKKGNHTLALQELLEGMIEVMEEKPQYYRKIINLYTSTLKANGNNMPAHIEEKINRF